MVEHGAFVAGQAVVGGDGTSEVAAWKGSISEKGDGHLGSGILASSWRRWRN